MNYLLPERLDALARAYALGTLSTRAERRFATLVAHSPDAAQAVARWREVLGTLELGAPAAMRLDDHVWNGVQERLFAREGRPAAVPGAAAAGRPPRRGGSLAWVWPGLAGLCAGLALFAGLVQVRPQALSLEPVSGHPQPAYVGVLLDPQGQAAVATIARRHGRVLTVRLLRPVALAPGETLSLWAWNDVDPTPRRLGAFAAPQTADLALPAEAEAVLGKVTHLGLAREGAGATAASAPAAMLAQGACAKVW